MTGRFRSSKFLFLIPLALCAMAALGLLKATDSAFGNSAADRVNQSPLLAQGETKADKQIHHDDEYWKKNLDPWVYQVTRRAATEPPFTGKYWNNHETGDYKCSNCGAVLFDSSDKFESGTGWPSFTKPVKGSVADRADNSLGMSRDEVVCKYCGAHLGHVFDDGPAPTGQRFCINSASLNFERAAKKTNEAAKTVNP